MKRYIIIAFTFFLFIPQLTLAEWDFWSSRPLYQDTYTIEKDLKEAFQMSREESERMREYLTRLQIPFESKPEIWNSFSNDRQKIIKNLETNNNHRNHLKNFHQEQHNIFISLPFLKQKKKLSCEIATLRIALEAHDIYVSEDTLENKLPFSTYNQWENGIWGDPQKGFVGNISGNQTYRTGYGVYWEPIAELAKQYLPKSYAKERLSLEEIVYELSQGNPIIIWGIQDLRLPIKDISWKTPTGKHIQAFDREHTWVIHGFDGTLDNPRNFFVINPLDGHKRISVEKFARTISFFHFSGVVVK